MGSSTLKSPLASGETTKELEARLTAAIEAQEAQGLKALEDRDWETS